MICRPRRTRGIRDAIEPARNPPDTIRELVERNRSLVFACAKAVCRRVTDEAVSDGDLGLLRAATRFNHDCGVKFSTYATHVICSAINLGEQKRMRNRQVEKTNADEAMRLRGYRDELPWATRIEEYRRLIDGRSPCMKAERHRDVFDLLYGDGCSQQDAADVLGISKQRVHQIRNQIIRHLRAKLIEPDGTHSQQFATTAAP